MEQCKVMVLANQKGGVSKTVSTVNLGVGLSRAGYEVLLVDTDPQDRLFFMLTVFICISNVCITKEEPKMK